MQIRAVEVEASTRRTIGSACILMFLISLDVTIVNVALPAIQDALIIETTSLGWVIVTYTLPFATLMLSAGALSDRFGSAKVYLSGVVIFGIGSLIDVVAPNFTFLLLGRVVQGIGAALCMPSTLAVLRSTVPSHQLGRAIALWSFSASMAISAGPILSGFLVQYTNWRSIFIINLPIVTLVAWLIFPVVLCAKKVVSVPKHAVDVSGQALYVVSAFLLISGLIFLRDQADILQGRMSAILLFLCISGVVAFFLCERRAVAPVIPASLMRHKVFQSAVIVGGSVSFVNFGLVYCLGLYYGVAHQSTPLKAGALYLPMMLASAASTSVVERVRRALGDRMTVATGLVSQFAGSIFISLQPDHVGWVSANAAFLGFGVGLVLPPVTSGLLATVDVNISGVASGAFSSIRQLAGAIGVAALSLLVQGTGTSVNVDLRSVSAVCAVVLMFALGTYLAKSR